MSNAPTLPPPDSLLDPGHGTRDPELPSAAVYHCSHCGYNLHGIPLTGHCPECGQSAQSRLAPADFLKHDASRKFWIHKSLHLILLALTLDLALAFLKLGLLISGHLALAATLTGWLMGLWLVMLSAAAYMLFYGITRVNKKGYPVLARSILLYLTTALAILYTLHLWLFLGGFLPASDIPYVLIIRYIPPSICFVISLTSVLLLLYGIHLTCASFSKPIGKTRLPILAIAWLALCLLGLGTTPHWQEKWNKFCHNNPPSLLTFTPSPDNRSNIPAWFYSRPEIREINASQLNRLTRVDPGPGYWSELIGSGVSHAIIDYKNPSAQFRYRINRTQAPPYQMGISLAEASFVQIDPQLPPYNQRIPTPVAIGVVYIAWPEIIIALLAWALSLFFSISLLLLTLRLRKTLHLLITNYDPA